jgi:hypothetical protein
MSLIDFENNQMIILLQGGIFSTFEDGFWLDKNNVVITSKVFNSCDEKETILYEIYYYVINLKTFQINIL